MKVKVQNIMSKKQVSTASMFEGKSNAQILEIIAEAEKAQAAQAGATLGGVVGGLQAQVGGAVQVLNSALESATVGGYLDSLGAPVLVNAGAGAGSAVVNSAAPVVVNGASVSGARVAGAPSALPADLANLWAESAKAPAVREAVGTPVKFSIVGGRIKSLNVYHTSNEAGYNGLRVALEVIKARGFVKSHESRNTVTRTEGGKQIEVDCAPYHFLKLVASANKVSAATMLVTIDNDLTANGVSWS